MSKWCDVGKFSYRAISIAITNEINRRFKKASVQDRVDYAVKCRGLMTRLTADEVKRFGTAKEVAHAIIERVADIESHRPGVPWWNKLKRGESL